MPRLLSDAGVDTLIFDATNAETYPGCLPPNSARSSLRTSGPSKGAVGRRRSRSWSTPRRGQSRPSSSTRTCTSPGGTATYWFHLAGQAAPALRPGRRPYARRCAEFFTLRRAHWPFTLVNTPYAWHWEATYPQPYGYTVDPKKAEQVNVSVAQNLRGVDGRVTNMSASDARGRSFHDASRDTSVGALDRGGNFQEQWKRVFELDPPFAMVTGWNEWIAGRWGKPGGPVEFVDQLDREFSRDIEPMKGGHGDNYYCQLAANVRRYKGVAAMPKASRPRSRSTSMASSKPGRTSSPEFLDELGDTAPRDFDGAGGTHYVDRSGRNDLVACKVARDSKDVFFYARTRESLTPRTDPNWMVLMIDADRDPRTGWEGFDFIVNRTIDADGSSWLERSVGGWSWEKVAKVRMRIGASGNEPPPGHPPGESPSASPKARAAWPSTSSGPTTSGDPATSWTST